MLNALAVFQESIAEAKQQSVLHEFLTAQLIVPVPFDDLLRAQFVQVVGALDKLMHDIIRIGMCQIYGGSRVATPRYLSESIPLQLHSALIGATLPPKEIIFEQAVVAKLSFLSFQHPDKISEGLSMIWSEKQKWQKIAAAMGQTSDATTTRLRLIVSRRNAIVHESDMDPLSNAKTPIARPEVDDATQFIEACGISIATLVA